MQWAMNRLDEYKAPESGFIFLLYFCTHEVVLVLWVKQFSLLALFRNNMQCA